jgi:hypothetical protein
MSKLLKNKKNKLIQEKKEMVFEFDKFMDEIVQKENVKTSDLINESVEDTPQMKYQKRYSELPQNKIKIS